MMEKLRVGVFENGVLRKHFGLTGKWKRLHGMMLRDLHCSPNIIRVNCHGECDGGARGTNVGEKRCIQSLVGKLEKKTQLECLTLGRTILKHLMCG